MVLLPKGKSTNSQTWFTTIEATSSLTEITYSFQAGEKNAPLYDIISWATNTDECSITTLFKEAHLKSFISIT